MQAGHRQMPLRLGVAAAFLLCLPVFTQSEAPAASSSTLDESPASLYNPPKDAIPRARVGGQMRGTSGSEPEVQALVPDHVGLTVSRTPDLNWFLSKPTKHEVRFTLVDNRVIRPLHETQIPTPKEPGIQTIKLKDLGVTLDPNVQYRWYVSVVRDTNSPSQDIVAGGIIERCELSECITVMDAKLACNKQGVIENAKAGFWYDAMGCVCTLINNDPLDGTLRRIRAALLRQVGLNGVAEWDLRALQSPSVN